MNSIKSNSFQKSIKPFLYNNISSNSSINNRFYSSLSATPPINKPRFTINKNYPAVNARKAVDNTRLYIYRAKESLDRGLLYAAERFIVSSFKDFQRKIDFSSSLFAYPTYAVGLVSLKKGYYLNSEKFLKLSLNRNEAIDETNPFIQKNIVESTNDLGLTLLRQGRTEESGYNLFKSEDLAIKNNVDKLLPSIYSNIGEYYKDLCYYDKSNFYHGQAHNYLLLGQPTDELNLARCYLNRAQILRLSNSLEECQVFLNYGAKTLIKYLDNVDSNSVPRHMDWSKFLVEFGHFYYCSGEFDLAKKKFVSAKNHFQAMNNSNTPDAIINMINLAIMEKNYPSFPTVKESNQYISEILSNIQKPLQLLKDQKFNSRSFRIDNVIKSLEFDLLLSIDNNNSTDTTTTTTSTSSTTTITPIENIAATTTKPNVLNNNNNNNNNNKSKVSKLKLIEPLHFQLMFLESDSQPIGNLDFLKVNFQPKLIN